MYKISRNELSDDILESLNSSGGNIKFKKNTVNVTSLVTSIIIGISTFNKNTDLLMVFKNSVYLEEGIDYIVSGDSLNITSIGEGWDNVYGSTTFNFICISGGSGINIGDGDITSIDGKIIEDGTVDEVKLSSLLQIKIKNTITSLSSLDIKVDKNDTDTKKFISTIISKLEEIEQYNVVNDKNIKVLLKRSNKLDSNKKRYQYSLYSNVIRQIINNTFNIGLCTDTHFNDAELRDANYNTVSELKMFENICNSLNTHDRYILGDLVNGDYENNILFNDSCEFLKLTPKCNLIHGNHDTGAYIENLQIVNPTSYGERSNSLLAGFDMYNMFYKNNNFDKIDINTLAFYKDYEGQKIRVIHINTNDTTNQRESNGELKYNPINWRGITPKQIKWLIDNAFNFNTKTSNGLGWKIIILSHTPLEPALDDNSDFPFWYNLNGNNYSENVANSALIRWIIRKLNAGTTGSFASYLSNVPTITTGTYKKATLGGFTSVQYTTTKHSDNKKTFGTNYTINGEETPFNITMPQGVVIPVIACISGHMHTDNYYTLDDRTHHITLSGIANSREDDISDIDEFAITIMSIKNNELLFFRSGRGMGTVHNPNLEDGFTNYGIDAFKDKRFTFS